MPRPLRLTVALIALALVLTAAAPALAATEQQASRIGPPTPARAFVAEVLHPIEARARPASRARIVLRLAGQTAYSRTEQVLLVLAQRGGWVRVALPKRPNGSAGWVPLSSVIIRRTTTRIRVDIGSRTVQVLVGGRVRQTYRAAVGAPRTPTPTGLFAIADPIPSNGSLGPHVLVLTAYSDVLIDFLGGDGVAAIHGWRDAGAFGRAVSNGCVRVSPQVVTALAAVAPAGTPVEIVAD